MNYEDLRDYCLSLKGVTEHFPFDEFSLVMKVQGKMFALLPLDNPETQITLKCDPERAIQLRDEFPPITSAYHFNKKHCNICNEKTFNYRGNKSKTDRAVVSV